MGGGGGGWWGWHSPVLGEQWKRDGLVPHSGILNWDGMDLNAGSGPLSPAHKHRVMALSPRRQLPNPDTSPQIPGTSPQILAPVSKPRHQPANARYRPPDPGTRPQIPVPAPKPQGLLSKPQAPASKSRCKPQAGLRVAGPRPRPRPHLPDPGPWPRGMEGALPARRAPASTRSVPNSRHEPRPAPSPLRSQWQRRRAPL